VLATPKRWTRFPMTLSVTEEETTAADRVLSEERREQHIKDIL
jgi:hypothetical protein